MGPALGILRVGGGVPIDWPLLNSREREWTTHVCASQNPSHPPSRFFLLMLQVKEREKEKREESLSDIYNDKGLVQLVKA